MPAANGTQETGGRSAWPGLKNSDTIMTATWSQEAGHGASSFPYYETWRHSGHLFFGGQLNLVAGD